MKFIAANWKLYKSPAQARDFFARFNELQCPRGVEVIFFPSAFSLEAVSQSAKGWSYGAQNTYCKSEGAFTGENSLQVAKELGARYNLIGHSERRSLFGEQDDFLAQKLSFTQQMGLTPMLCIGESLQQREAGETRKVLEKQLRADLAQAEAKSPLVIAYEPVWAIGTGKVATPEQVAETHTDVAEILADLGFAGTPVLYGGSVKPDNAGGLINLPHVAGFLVGGASLEAESFAKIVSAAV